MEMIQQPSLSELKQAIIDAENLNVAELPKEILQVLVEYKGIQYLREYFNVLKVIGERVINLARIKAGDNVMMVNDNVQLVEANIASIVDSAARRVKPNHPDRIKMLVSYYAELDVNPEAKLSNELGKIDLTLYDGTLTELNIPLIESLLAKDCKLTVLTDSDLGGANRINIMGNDEDKTKYNSMSVQQVLQFLSFSEVVQSHKENLNIIILTNNSASVQGEIPDIVSSLGITVVQKDRTSEYDMVSSMYASLRVVLYKGQDKIPSFAFTLLDLISRSV